MKSEPTNKPTRVKALWESRRLSGGEGVNNFNVENLWTAITLPVPEARPSRKREGFVCGGDFVEWN